jgi:hypothetical protein
MGRRDFWQNDFCENRGQSFRDTSISQEKSNCNNACKQLFISFTSVSADICSYTLYFFHGIDFKFGLFSRFLAPLCHIYCMFDFWRQKALAVGATTLFKLVFLENLCFFCRFWLHCAISTARRLTSEAKGNGGR